MTHDEINSLRQDTEDLFYHGYRNYLDHAYPEDELKPISCKPQTRDRANPGDIGLNDVLGNYSLTLIDSLSTLAILASGDVEHEGKHALQDFQDGVQRLVELYGHGTDAQRCGIRACGFDLDSKVQVFETNIRGVGGLLSAHLFATGELPISGYNPQQMLSKDGTAGIVWSKRFTYSDQLLNLAHDLAQRLLPAFNNPSGLPYPRVNLRHGAPFYDELGDGICSLDGSSSGAHEATETCAAGAGSLVLEFATLSRLTGDQRFERLARRAFWAVWERRSPIGLIGNGIDAESGQWAAPSLTGIGAGIDSFFEYSVKAHVLLSNLPFNTTEDLAGSPDDFWHVWAQAHAAVKHHVYRGSHLEKYPYYGQVDLTTGAPRYSWIDNLSAYYPGLLVLAGEVDEAIEAHLLFCALWTRYNALPERWHAINAFIDPNFKQWPGRPEFIESTFYLYQATKDPFYLHVGEMALRDIRRRCWTKCGWADLGDVTTGQQRDRMESFFLGETAKYLYLLFSNDHPLNRLDRPIVFSTEGHPLIIPDSARADSPWVDEEQKQAQASTKTDTEKASSTCPAPIPPLPLTVSNTANRKDYFHAASLVQLHLSTMDPTRSSPLMETSQHHPGISYADVRSPTNYTFYPWTLPKSLVPAQGSSAPIVTPLISTLTFPNLAPPHLGESVGNLVPSNGLHKFVDGVIINSLSNLRLNMIQEPKPHLVFDTGDQFVDQYFSYEYRIHGVANMALGRNEKVMLTPQALQGVSPSDPHFTRVKDLEMVDLVIDAHSHSNRDEDTISTSHKMVHSSPGRQSALEELWTEVDALLSGLFSSLSDDESNSLDEGNESPTPISKGDKQPLVRHKIPAILPTGAGSAPLPQMLDLDSLPSGLGHLPFNSVLFLDSTLCTSRLPAARVRSYKILVIKRGGCSFSEKLANIPSIPPGPDALQLVIVLSMPEHTSRRKQSSASNEDPNNLIRPMLDQVQLTPNGIERRHPLALVMIHGSDANTAVLKSIARAHGRFDEHGKYVETRLEDGTAAARRPEHDGTGVGIKRRFWFESMGLPIGNLVML